MADDLEMVVDGRVFSDWTAVTVTRSLDRMSDTFSVRYTDREALDGEMLSIEEFDAVEIKLAGECVLTGFVDNVSISYDAKQHSFTATGRSKTGQLVDCSAIHETGSWEETGILDIANDLMAPFDLTTQIGDDAADDATIGDIIDRSFQLFRKFSIEQGETVFSALDRMAKLRGLLWTARADGQPALTKNGSRRAASGLEYGKNILRGQRRADVRDRFSDYIVLSQSAGDNAFNGDSARGGFAQATDEAVPLNRPMVFISEGTAASGDLVRRSEWERNTRGGKSRTLIYTVVGWTDGEAVWRPNLLIDVDDRFFRVEDQLLISEVRLSMSPDEGRRTELTLVPPAAFDPLRAPKTRSNRKTWSQWD